MWTPLDVPIEVSRNGTTPISLEIWDDIANEPVDLSGLALTCGVASALGESSLYSPACSVPDPVAGLVDINFDGSVLSAVPGAQETVRLAYEVKASDGQATVTVMRGPLLLIPGI